nr:serine acetyltransferase [uncultured Capnocytophaga sp.]
MKQGGVKKIAIIGAGGFGQEVYYLWRDMLSVAQESFEFVGFFDDNEDILISSGKIEELNAIDFSLEVAIAIGNTKHIHLVKNRLCNDNLKFPNIIHPSAQFLDRGSVLLGEGNIFAMNSMVSCNVEIGSFNIFNTRVTLGHDVVLGNFNVLSPNVQLSGGVIVGDENFFGFNSGVIQQKKIGNRNTIGAGAILLRHIKDEGTYLGNPAIKVTF